MNIVDHLDSSIDKFDTEHGKMSCHGVNKNVWNVMDESIKNYNKMA